MATTLDVEALIQQGRKCLRRGELPRAADLFGQAVTQDSGSIAAHEGLATAAFLMQNYDRAIELFRRVLQLDPRRAQPLVNLGAVYNRQKHYQQAIKALRQALSKDRRCAEAYYNLGIAHRGLNQLSMAVSAYREAIRLAPEMAEAYQNLANVYLEMGNVQQAILNYRRALELRPDFERAKHGLERAQLAAAEAKQAVSPFGRLVRIEETAPKVEDIPLRILTPQDRFEDRLAVHGRAKALERAASVVLNQLRDELEPALLELAHAFMQSDGRYDFNDEFMAFQRAFGTFRQVVRLLDAASESLREHERQIRGA